MRIYILCVFIYRRVCVYIAPAEELLLPATRIAIDRRRRPERPRAALAMFGQGVAAEQLGTAGYCLLCFLLRKQGKKRKLNGEEEGKNKRRKTQGSYSLI